MKKKLAFLLMFATLGLGLVACGDKKVSVELTACGDTKIKLVKAVQEVTDLGVKDAKEIVDNVPSIVVEDVSEEEAEAIKEKLEAASGTVTIK